MHVDGVDSDYGDHQTRNPTPEPDQPWPVRADPFSSYRTGFEVRTRRLCRRVLRFHHFPESDLGQTPRLIQAIVLSYQERTEGSLLTEAATQRFRWLPDEAGYESARLPPLTFDYTRAAQSEHPLVNVLPEQSVTDLADRIGGVSSQYWARWIDLDGDGFPGILARRGSGLYYKSNLGGGVLEPFRHLSEVPVLAGQAGLSQLMDPVGDRKLRLVALSNALAGYHERNPEGSSGEGEWGPFQRFRHLPNIDWGDPNLRFVDLDGDGRADVLLTEDYALSYHRSLGLDGFGERRRSQPLSHDDEAGPRLVFAEPLQTVFLADMSGDGLSDLVRIRNGGVCYWPNLGYGRFGSKVTMGRAPRFDDAQRYDPSRLRLADVDGTGPTDLIYIGHGHVDIWRNQSGNRFGAVKRLEPFPWTNQTSNLQVLDLLADGTQCLVWSSSLANHRQRSVRFVQLNGGQRPNLLSRVHNNLGAETHVSYGTSTQHFRRDRDAGRPWLSKLPVVVPVVDRIEVHERINQTVAVTRYAYHHGHWDPIEREFAGFAMVESWDAESLPDATSDGAERRDLPPVLTRTWFHTGLSNSGEGLEAALRAEYWQADPDQPELPLSTIPSGLSPIERRQATRALRGTQLRREIYAEDGSARAAHPYSVQSARSSVELLQATVADVTTDSAADAPQGTRPWAVFAVYSEESIGVTYERNPADPRTTHSVVLERDSFGSVVRSASIAYPRRAPQFDEQAETAVVFSEKRPLHLTDSHEYYRLNLPIESRSYQLQNPPAPRGLYAAAELREAWDGATNLAYHEHATELAKRLLSQARVYYRADDLTPLPLGQSGGRGLVHEAESLAFTETMLLDNFGDRVAWLNLETAGYRIDRERRYWTKSGHETPDPELFYLPRVITDPFGAEFQVSYDATALTAVSVTDPLGSRSTVTLDYATVQPKLVTDPNGNRRAARFDALGRVTATAVLGKTTQELGDTLDDPTTIIEYDSFRYLTSGQPARVRTLQRETHRDPETRWIEALGFTDGLGREVMTKGAAEPGLAPSRTPDGELIRDRDGQLVLTHSENRYRASGRAVYDRSAAVRAVFQRQRRVRDRTRAGRDWRVFRGPLRPTGARISC